MKRLKPLVSTLLLTLIWSLLIATPAIAQDGYVVLGVPADVLTDYHKFMSGRSPMDVTTFEGPNSRRDVVEVVLFQQALLRGGLDADIAFKPLPNYSRIITDLYNGDIASAGTSIWLYDLQKNAGAIHISAPIIQEGEFEAGFYTSPDNARALEADSISLIQQLAAASNKHWVPDWTTLSRLNLKRLHHIQDWKAMVRMVVNQRADFLLAPFQQTDGMMLTVDSMTLVPIEGIKIGLTGSRHFAVSRTHPMGEAVFDALQRGLKLMRQDDTIRRAYSDCGFFNHNVRQWKTIR